MAQTGGQKFPPDFVLYIHPDSDPSKLAFQAASLIPASRLHIQDITQLQALPYWLNGTPILVDSRLGLKLSGTDAIMYVEKLRDIYLKEQHDLLQQQQQQQVVQQLTSQPSTQVAQGRGQPSNMLVARQFGTGQSSSSSSSVADAWASDVPVQVTKDVPKNKMTEQDVAQYVARRQQSVIAPEAMLAQAQAFAKKSGLPPPQVVTRGPAS